MINALVRRTEKIIRTDILYAIRGLFWFGLQHAGSAVGGLAVSVIFANFLPKETYGLYRYALSVFSILMLSNIARADDSLSISVANGYEGDFLNICKARMKWGLLGSLAGLGLALYWFLRGEHILAHMGLLMAAFVPFFEPPMTYNGFLIGKRRFKKMSVIGTVINAAYSIAIATTVLLSRNPIFLLASYLITNTLLRMAMLAYVVKSEKPNARRDDRTLSYGKKLSVIEIFSAISGQIDSILLFHYIGPAEVAAYTFIKRIPEQIKFIPKYLTALSTPKFSTKDISDPYIKRETMWKSVVLFFLLLGCALVYIACAPLIFKYLFKPYQQYVQLSQIFSLSMPLNFGGLFLNFIETSRREDIVFKLNILSPVSRILIIFFSIHFFGLAGLVWGFLASRLVVTLWRAYFFYKA